MKLEEIKMAEQDDTSSHTPLSTSKMQVRWRAAKDTYHRGCKKDSHRIRQEGKKSDQG